MSFNTKRGHCTPNYHSHWGQGRVVTLCYQLLMLAGLSGLIMTSSLAGTTGSINRYQYVFGVSAGPVWWTGVSTQIIQSSPETIRTYTANNSDNVIADGELFFGIQRELKQTLLKNHPIKGQIGLALATTSHANVSGHIWDDANPAFDNFIYSYEVIHTHIAAKGKLLTELAHNLQPYINGSLGAGFNESLHFESYPTIFEALPIASFTSKITDVFTYTVGAGLQWGWSQHWQAGIGYEFSDWGKTQLLPASGQLLGSGLTENHFYTNGLLFSINYLA